MKKILFTAWCLFVVVYPGFTQDNATDLEIDGLVIDKTKTKMGRDFYVLFYTNWEAPEVAHDFTITIIENPLPTFGSLVQVKVNSEVVFQQRLTPRYEETKQLATIAIQVTQQYLINYEEYQKQLTGDDMKGTGIY